MCSSSVDTEYSLMYWCCVWLQLYNSRFSKCFWISCMLSSVSWFLFLWTEFVFNLVYVCVFSRSAVWVVRPRVHQMRRLLWWALTNVIRHCRFALVHSSEITAALRRANRPATRSEFIFLSVIHLFVCFDTCVVFESGDFEAPHIEKRAPTART